MLGTMCVGGQAYGVVEAELHLPGDADERMFYLGVSNEAGGGFGLWEVLLTGLASVDDLDGRRMHVHADGRTFDDDTLGTDIVGYDSVTDLNYLSTSEDGEAYCYGEIRADFERIEGRRHRCRMWLTLTTSDEDPEELSEAEFDVTATAEFEVCVDEEDI